MRAEIKKQPWEKYGIGADFSDDYVTGEVVVVGNSSVIAYDLNDDNAVVTAVKSGDPYRGTDPDYTEAKSNAMLCQVITAGAHGDNYKFTFRATSNLGNKFEKDIYVKVREV